MRPDASTDEMRPRRRFLCPWLARLHRHGCPACGLEQSCAAQGHRDWIRPCWSCRRTGVEVLDQGAHCPFLPPSNPRPQKVEAAVQERRPSPEIRAPPLRGGRGPRISGNLATSTAQSPSLSRRRFRGPASKIKRRAGAGHETPRLIVMTELAWRQMSRSDEDESEAESPTQNSIGTAEPEQSPVARPTPTAVKETVRSLGAAGATVSVAMIVRELRRRTGCSRAGAYRALRLRRLSCLSAGISDAPLGW
jgi:hypothetical protein